MTKTLCNKMFSLVAFFACCFPLGILSQGTLLNSTTFDYIVIGGGTAGLTVASRLTEDVTVRVLVIEAGNDTSLDLFVTTPGLSTAQIGDAAYDWSFASVPQVRRHWFYSP